MRKTLGLIVAFILVAGILAGCSTVNNAGGKGATIEPQVSSPKIRFGYLPSMAQAAFIVAKEKGWFEEEFSKNGTVIEYQKFMVGPPLIEAFAGDRLDFGFVGDQPVIQAKANNIDLKVVGVCSATEKGAGLVVPVGSDIVTPKDLKGKKVGVSVGSIFHQILLIYLKDNGLKPGDIKLVNMNPPDMKTALATKDIDAVVLGEPWISMIEYEKIGQQIADTTGIKLNLNVIATSAKLAQEYPDTVNRVLKVYDKAAKWLQDHPEEGAELIAKATGLNREVVAKAIVKANYDIQLTDAAVNSITDTARFLRENNTIRKDVNVTELIETSYLKEIGFR
ncbi:Putative aliphatic sulfonates-binding protein [Sporomusa silvacetica DSM 10669]|uniref:Aliphatic sulfonates-binding protein n=1 Tax=Sporomusa silvacetica DSM 10669 TaxID=1123289 RepID=A0ABZ3IS01_9FIRM|nr:aliphatic sulfonate ABC transporter substrate-binding protein [Sporomusa silvacetica]OZC15314.1 putative aliphatic sulfonates-binding protein precursor [Sporomusa silvacetica DSM 10669]